MRKAPLALAAAAMLGFATVAAPSPAHAWRGGFFPGVAGGLIAGAVIGGIASNAYAYGPGYGYYDGYAPAYYGGYYGGGYAPAYYGGYYGGATAVVRAVAYYGGEYGSYYGGPLCPSAVRRLRLLCWRPRYLRSLLATASVGWLVTDIREEGRRTWRPFSERHSSESLQSTSCTTLVKRTRRPRRRSAARSSAVCRSFNASAYSGEAYHSRKRSIDGNSTMMMLLRRRAAFDHTCGAAAHQITAAILRDRFRGDGAIGLETCRVTHIDFGNNIGRHFSPHAMVWMMPPSARSAAPLVTEASFELT